MSDPLVSVVIPTYNRAEIICRTIDNVFQQTYRNLEIIIVDDGSTDETHLSLNKYGDRIRVLTQRNLGPAIARNNGARAAQGEIIAFQDSDDLWQTSKLERQVALLQTDSSIPCCLCGVLMRYVNGKPFTSFDHSLVRFPHEEGVWLNVFEVLATRFVLFNQAAAIRREAFERIGGFPEDLKYLEDYDLPLRLSLEGPWAFIREPLVTYGEASAVSFSAQARKDAVLLANCELKVYDRILAKTDRDNKNARARRTLKWRAEMTGRKLAALNLEGHNRPFAKAEAKLLLALDRYRLALFRRSPWFPQPITKAIDLKLLGHARAAERPSVSVRHSLDSDEQIKNKFSLSVLGKGL
jgi:glycosyltransferase involved in cell wall biosynthesis